ncbi:AAA family ATPase [Planctomonas psychrotolerans]|uniref:AAA family ATPase n=1 Tax=Planctomonas psychrotolerans TaxID=2528712 RepID=UPI00123AF84A|nr:septum formation inhibitor-activating ATPase [Planctomonas psychrotolerans]
MLLALDVPTEDRLLGDVLAAGHTIVARVTGSAEILAALEPKRVELAIVSAANRCLTRAVLDECDRCGARMVALAADDVDRRNAVAVGLHEVLDAAVHWTDIERVVSAYGDGSLTGGVGPGAAETAGGNGGRSNGHDLGTVDGGAAHRQRGSGAHAAEPLTSDSPSTGDHASGMMEPAPRAPGVAISSPGAPSDASSAASLVDPHPSDALPPPRSPRMRSDRMGLIGRWFCALHRSELDVGDTARDVGDMTRDADATVGRDGVTRSGAATGRREDHSTTEAESDGMLEPATTSKTSAQKESVAGHTRGTVIAVWGPTGAPGRTTIAITIAAEIAATGATVVLADADTYGGAVAPALGLRDEAPGFAAACRLAGAGRLTRAELMRIGQRYSSTTCAFWVLTGIGRPGRWPELSADRVTKSIEACREWAEYVVIDTGFSLESDEEISSDLFAPRRNAATNAALRAADRIVAVGAADPIGLARFLRAHVDLLELLDGQRVSVLINRVRAGVIGLNPGGQVTQTLSRFGGIHDPVLVPDDPAATDAALLSGSILRDVAPRSPALGSVSAFVRADVLPPATLRTRRRARHQRMPFARRRTAPG